MSYTKLFSHIVTSSIWTEDDQTRIVWITMLALSDKRGEVMASIPGLARVAGVPIPALEAALTKFLSPDPYSRTPDEEGRRIEKIEGGWLIINYAKHRRMASIEEQKERNAVRQQRFRERQKRNATVTPQSRLSNGSVTHQTDNAEAEAEAEAEADKKLVSGKPKPISAKPTESSVSDHGRFIALWTEKYQAELGTVYAFQGGQDGKAVKLLLDRTKKTPEELVEIAILAWRKPDGFWSKQAVTISGFNSKFNQIYAEVRKTKPKNESKYANAFLHQN